MSNTSTERVLRAESEASDGFGLEAYRSMRGIDVTITAELGRRLISVGELLRLQVDDVLVLARPTGENVDLYAGDVLLGNAEILGTNEKLAIRVAELLEQPASLPGRTLAAKQSAGSFALASVSSDEG